LLLVNLGTPEAATPRAVRRWLGEFLHDYRVVDLTRWLWCPLLHGVILPLRARKVAKNYASIWTAKGSPLLVLSQELAAAMQAELPEFEVALAMRYGQPSVSAVLRGLQAKGVERVLVLPLYPQYSATTVAAVHDAVMAELMQWRRLPELRLINDYHRDEAWLDALEASVENCWDLHGRGDKLLISFHGLPQRVVDNGDPYAVQCAASVAAIAGVLGLHADDYVLTFQSRFGKERWLEPATITTLESLARGGVRRVDVVCPGFAVDCLETLEEIAIENAKIFRDAGGEALRYIPCLNDAPAHADALAAIATRAMAS